MSISPTLAEFLDSARGEFEFLCSEFGFSERSDRAVGVSNPFSVRFADAVTVVTVEGINHGFAAQVTVGPLHPDDPSDWPAHVPLWAILKVRRPDLHDRVIEAHGQLTQVREYARALREAAPDVLRGDFTMLAEARTVIRSQDLEACRPAGNDAPRSPARPSSGPSTSTRSALRWSGSLRSRIWPAAFGVGLGLACLVYWLATGNRSAVPFVAALVFAFLGGGWTLLSYERLQRFVKRHDSMVCPECTYVLESGEAIDDPIRCPECGEACTAGELKDYWTETFRGSG